VVEDRLISAPEVLPTSVVRAWEAASFQVGWMRENAVGAPVFNVGDQGAPGDVPAFRLRRLRRWNQRPVANLPPPTTTFGLCFKNIGTGNAALQALPTMNHLHMLDLTGSAVTDEGLLYLVRLQNLCVLSLDDTPVTTAGLQHIAGLPKLRSLQLSECWELTDDSFQPVSNSTRSTTTVSRSVHHSDLAACRSATRPATALGRPSPSRSHRARGRA
jgi:hypothetical protein